MVEESLTLKWGTLKGWRLSSPVAMELRKKYGDLGTAAGAMQQHDTPEQKEVLCELIDAVAGPIRNDWSGEEMTKEEAKKYVRGDRS